MGEKFPLYNIKFSSIYNDEENNVFDISFYWNKYIENNVLINQNSEQSWN